MTDLENLDIKDFTEVSSIDGKDYILLVRSSGTHGKISVALFNSSILSEIKPSIRDGYWWIGEVPQDIVAEGQTPVFRKGPNGVEWKYKDQGEGEWKLLVNYSDISFTFEDLTPEQKDELKLHFSDLTEEDIKVLQQPAADATDAANEAADAANKAAENANKAAQAATASSENANAATSSANSAAVNANAAAGKANAAAGNVNDAIFNANQLPKIQDGTWWVWNIETGEYINSGSPATGRSPLIQNETWWVWDDATGQYVNTNQSVNSSYVLTKAKVEDVLTGDISSHTHSKYVLGTSLAEWVKQPNKPTYSASEVGAIPTGGLKTINNQSLEGKGNIELETEVTKEDIESVFTGNIESHSHDSVFEYGDYEVDVWDGVTIADSIQGSGTKEDPYLISSCAEWLYFWNNSDSFIPTEGLSSNITELVYFVKLVKSLDFNNKPYIYQEQSKSGLCDVDGGNATISNFIIEDGQTGNGCEGNRFGIANCVEMAYFHNFNLANVTIKKTINVTVTGNSSLGFDFFTTGNGAPLIGMQSNNYIQGRIIISGSIKVNTSIQMLESGVGMYLISFAPELVKNTFRDKNLYFGYSVEFVDVIIKNNDSKLTISRTIVKDYDNIIGGTGSIIGYDNSFSNISGVEGSDPIFDEGSIQNVMIFSGSDYSNIFNCSDKSKGFVVLSSDGSLTFINTQGKTLEELNSDTFIDTVLNSKEQVFKKGEVTPILSPLNKIIKYDGYAKQSTFDALKESVEGNSTIHTHDRVTEIGDFETDVWDGTTIATSVKGSGTIEDPYIINSCAEWLYFWSNSNSLVKAVSDDELRNLSEFQTFIKLNKNLDFNNKAISYSTAQKGTYLCDVNGCGVTISNVKMSSNSQYLAFGLANTPALCYFHNFNIQNLDVSLSSEDGNPLYSFSVFTEPNIAFERVLETDNYIKGRITLSGQINKNLASWFILGGIGLFLSSYAIKQKFVNLDWSLGLDVDIINNATIAEGFTNAIFKLVFHPDLSEDGTSSNIHPSVYDNSRGNITGYDSVTAMPIFEGNYCETLFFVGTNSDKVFINKDKAKGFLAGSFAGDDTLFIDTQSKTQEELNSDLFINEVLNKEGVKFIKGETTPVIAPFGTEIIKYDGYVRQSVFEEYKRSVIIVEEPFVNIDLDLTGTIHSLSSEEQRKILGHTYVEVTNDNIISLLGGVDGIRDLYNKLKITSSPKIITMPVVVFIAPVRCLPNMYYAFVSSDSNIDDPYTPDEIPDGKSVSISFEISGALNFQIGIQINNFNTETMSANFTSKAGSSSTNLLNTTKAND